MCLKNFYTFYFWDALLNFNVFDPRADNAVKKRTELEAVKARTAVESLSLDREPCFSLVMDGNMAVLKRNCFGGANCLPKNIKEDTQWLSRNYLMYAHIHPKQRVEGRRDQVFRSEDLREASVPNMTDLWLESLQPPWKESRNVNHSEKPYKGPKTFLK